MPTSTDVRQSTIKSLFRLTQQNLTGSIRSWEAVTTATGDLASTMWRQPSPAAWWSSAPWEWVAHMTTRQQPGWASSNQVRLTTPIARLRDFSETSASDNGRDDDVIPTLVLPPQAGHSSTVVDFSRRQSQMATIRACGLTRAYAMEWRPATAATRRTTVEDYIEVISRAIAEIGGPVNLIGDCQGGWLAAIYAALHPTAVHTLTLAGAPIDFHDDAAPIALSTKLMTGAFGLAPYRALVAVAGGNMPGSALLNGFIAIQPQAEVAKQLQLLNNLDNASYVRRYHDFEDWFKHTQDVPGTFYLWLVEHLFRRNELIRGELVVGGDRVDLQRITCPLYLLAGATDHITPPRQLFAARHYVGTPPEQIIMETSDGGHLGLFMGREALRNQWPTLLAHINRQSRQQAPAEEAQRATPEQPNRPALPAP